MTRSEVLTRIIGPEATLRDVELAFSGQHPDLPFYTWIAQAELTHEIISVAGLVFENGVEIGHYRRRADESRPSKRNPEDVLAKSRYTRASMTAKKYDFRYSPDRRPPRRSAAAAAAAAKTFGVICYTAGKAPKNVPAR